MTLTEQDKELRERIELDWLWLTHTCSAAEQKSVDRTLDKMVQLITADRKRVALEARIDELEQLPQAIDDLTAYAQDVYLSLRKVELKAQQEEVK